jgi:hypothetical protein
MSQMFIRSISTFPPLRDSENFQSEHGGWFNDRIDLINQSKAAVHVSFFGGIGGMTELRQVKEKSMCGVGGVATLEL